MKIEYDSEMNSYFLHDGRLFSNVLDLVNYYRSHNLSEAFNNMDMMLRATVLKSNFYRVRYHYEGSDPVKYLTLRPGRKGLNVQ